MLLLFLLLIFIVLLVVCYQYFNKDIIHPSVVFCAVYVISIFCALLNVNKWDIVLNDNTLYILLFGGMIFVAVSALIDNYYQKKYGKEKPKNNEVKTITIDKPKLIFYSIYNLVICLLTLYYVYAIASKYGDFNSFSEMLSIFRNNTSYQVNDAIPHYVAFLTKFSIVFSAIALYAFINNLVIHITSKSIKTFKKVLLFLKKQILYILPILIYILSLFVRSERKSIISLIIMAIAYFLIIYNKKKKFNKPIKLKTIGKLAIVMLVLLVCFYFSASIIGRKNNKNLFDYITFYIGGSIECLNLYVENPVPKSDIIGKESFYYFIKNLSDYHIVDGIEKYSSHLEFRYHNKVMVGNIYTAYRRWLQDFGYIGMVIMQIIMSAFFTIYYNKLKYNKAKKGYYNLWLIIYGYIFYMVVLHPIDGYFYMNLFRLAALTSLIIFIMIYEFSFNFNFKYQKGLKVKYKGKYILNTKKE